MMRGWLAAGFVGLGAVRPAAAQVVATPSAASLDPYTPEQAVRDGVTGQAVVRCEVQRDGSLKACAVVSEAPGGEDFGAASIQAAQRLAKAKPPQDGGRPTVDVPFTWNPK